MAVESHYNIAPVIDIFGSVSGRDLGGIPARDINKLIDASRSHLPRGSQVIVRGQVATMRSSYVGLLAVWQSPSSDHLLIVVNFQSWLDPFIIISALPAALTGIAGISVPHQHPV